MNNNSNQLSVFTLNRERYLHGLLMVARQDGSAQAWKLFLQTLTPVIKGWLRLKLDERALQEDLLQEVLLAVYLKQANFDATRPFLPWLAAVTRYKLVDALKARQRHGLTLGLSESAIETAFLNHGMATQPQTDDRKDAEKLIERLPNEKQKQAMRAVILDHMDYQEAAKALGIEEGNLRTRLHRATQYLKEKVKKDEKYGTK